VQLFTVPSLVPLLVKEDDLLSVLFSCLAAAFTSALDKSRTSLDMNHSIFRHSRYMHLVNDLKYVLSMPGIASTVTEGDASLLATWLQIMTFSQGMDPNIRQVGAHVEYENDSWLRAFDLTVRLSPINNAIIAGFVENAKASVPCEDEDEELERLRAAGKQMSTVLNVCFVALKSWAEGSNPNSHLSPNPT